MKTINHGEKVYQVGAVYEFSDDGKHWYVDILEGTYQGSAYPYKARSGVYDFIRVCEAKVGTIEDAPTELIDGECYQYTDQLGNERRGYFTAEYNDFCRAGGWNDDVCECTNIKLLTVGE